MRRLRHRLTGILAVSLVVFGAIVAPARAGDDPKLTGTVVDASGPVAWPVLDLHRLDAAGWTFVDEVTGAQNGTFAVRLTGLDAGTWTVKFGDGDHQSQWLGGTDALPSTVSERNHFTLPAPGGVDLGTIVLSAPPRLTVHGRVDAPAGSQRGLLVQLAASDGDLAAGRAVDHTATAPDGSFSLSVPEAGDYVLQVGDPAHALATRTEPVDVRQDGQDLGTITLRGPTPSVVTGTVTVAGSPRAGVAVTTLVWHDDAALWPDPAFSAYASATTAADGSYSVAVEPGACFTVRYSLAGHAAGQLDGEEPQTCPATSGTRLALPSPGAANPVPPVDLVRSYDVTGTVVSTLGTGVGFAAVSVYPAGRAGLDDPITVAYADADGTFTVPVSSGDYAFGFSGTDVPFTATTRDAVVVRADASLGPVPVTLTQSVSGRIASADGPLEGATATLSILSGEHAGQTRRAVTGADGSYEFPVVAAGTEFRLQWSAHGFQAVTGGTVAMPAGSRAPDEVTLETAPSDLGRVAGQQLAQCTANRLPPGDDSASAAVPLPFPVRFFGATHTGVHVNTNGSISFTGPRAGFRPDQLTAATGVPLIAPFLADIDTSEAGDRLVGYGSDGNTFCVQWADARQYGGTGRVTFQLLLTRVGTNGDFDLTLNYDRIAWDTGISPQGTPAAAVAGFGDGTGAAGRSVRFAGSGTAGGLLDGGPNALVAGSQNATTAGRYVIPFRGGDTAGFGTLSGTLTGPEGSAAAGVVVSACRSAGGGTVCDTTTSRADGGFSFLALRAADYVLRVPDGQELADGPAAITVTAGSGSAAGVLRVRPKPSPSPTPKPSPTPRPTPPVVLPPEPLPSPSPSPTATPSPVLKALTPATPKISGTSRVGRTVKAKPGTWRPAGVTLSYRWLRDGKAIAGATRTTYKLRKADRGHRIRVTVTGRKVGYATAGRTSAATAKIRSG